MGEGQWTELVEEGTPGDELSWGDSVIGTHSVQELILSGLKSSNVVQHVVPMPLHRPSMALGIAMNASRLSGLRYERTNAGVLGVGR